MHQGNNNNNMELKLFSGVKLINVAVNPSANANSEVELYSAPRRYLHV